MCESAQEAVAAEVGPYPSDAGRLRGCTAAVTGEGWGAGWGCPAPRLLG